MAEWIRRRTHQYHNSSFHLKQMFSCKGKQLFSTMNRPLSHFYVPKHIFIPPHLDWNPQSNKRSLVVSTGFLWSTLNCISASQNKVILVWYLLIFRLRDFSEVGSKVMVVGQMLTWSPRSTNFTMFCNNLHRNYSTLFPVLLVFLASTMWGSNSIPCHFHE